MPTGTDLSQIGAVIDKLVVYASRTEVQIQLLAILGIVIFAGLVTRFVWRRWLGSVERWAISYPKRSRRAILKFGVSLLHAITFPLLTIVLLEIGRQVLVSRGLLGGLLFKAEWIFWTLIVFQGFVTLLYSFFDDALIRKYYYRLFLPLLIVFIVLQILSNITDLHALADTVLTTLFNSPLTLGAVFIATIGLYLWGGMARIVEDLIYHIVARRPDVDHGSVQAALTLMRYVLIAFGIVFVLSQLKLDPTTVAAITGGLSVGIGFALREILANFISGILLLTERSLQPGDVIEVGDEVSVVQDVRMRSTIVRTLNNDEVVIPNQMFFTDSFKTYTGTDKTVRVPIFVRTDCVIEPRHVVQVLVETALSHPDVLADPVPSVFLLEYGDNVASFQLNVWIDNPVLRPRVTSEIKMRVWDAFADNNIALPFPEVELHFPKKVNLEMLSPPPRLARATAAD